jgi:uncharacterized membrane protein YgaE (UPF0421/DUF939 family)
MTKPDAITRDARKTAASLLFDLLKSLSLRERLTEGGVMALQAVASTCIAYGLGRALHTPQAFWAAITAIAVTQHRYVDTRNLSRDQFIGAMAGGLFGLAGASFGGGLIAYAATVAMVIVACWCVNVGSAARLGAITATIVLLVPETGPIWDIALLRLGEVTLGTISALLVSWLVSSAERRWVARGDHSGG